MTPLQGLNELLLHPDHFIKYYPLSVAGWTGAHAPNAVNTHPFVLYKRDPLAPGSMPSGKVGHHGAMRPNSVLPFMTHEISSWAIDDQANGGVPVQGFTGHSVPMVTDNAANALNKAALASYQLDGTADVMITGQLSGCCFCWLPVGTTLLCTHIRPAPGSSGVILHNSLHSGGRFANHATQPLYTFGRNDYPSHATVIGVRLAGAWRLYAQLSTDHNRTNAQVMRLHPGPRIVL